MSKLTKRTVTITLPLVEAAVSFGFLDYIDKNRYLDADPHDDVRHPGYTASEILCVKCPINGVEKIFPLQVASALESADRDASAELISKNRRTRIKNCYEAMSMIKCQYMGRDSDGKVFDVDIPGGVKSATVSATDATVSVVIENPEHFFNAIMLNSGRSAPDENETDIVLTNRGLQSLLLMIARTFYQVYEINIPGESEILTAPSLSNELFKAEIISNIRNLESLEIGNTIVSAYESGRLNDSNSMDQTTKIVSEIMNTPQDEVRSWVKRALNERIETTKKMMDKILSN